MNDSESGDKEQAGGEHLHRAAENLRDAAEEMEEAASEIGGQKPDSTRESPGDSAGGVVGIDSELEGEPEEGGGY